MAQRLPVLSGREAVRKFTRSGWSLVRQRGSHMMMTHPRYRWTLTIPDQRELGPGLLKRLLRQAELTTDEFAAL